MAPVDLSLRLQDAPARLLRAAVTGQDRAVYVPLSGAAAGEFLWSDGPVSLYLFRARREGAGLVIDLRVVIEPPRPVAARAPAAA